MSKAEGKNRRDKCHQCEIRDGRQGNPFKPGLQADDDEEMQDVRRVTRTGQRPDELVGPVDHLPEEDDQPNAEANGNHGLPCAANQ
jgi:hypothetical protein